jgi:hypothetical protein
MNETNKQHHKQTNEHTKTTSFFSSTATSFPTSVLKKDKKICVDNDEAESVCACVRSDMVGTKRSISNKRRHCHHWTATTKETHHGRRYTVLSVCCV